MMKKFLTAVIFTAMTMSVNAETVATSVTTDISKQDIEQVKILVEEGKKAGLTEQQTLQLVAEQLESNALVDGQSLSPRTKKILFWVTVAIVAGVSIVGIYKIFFSKEDPKKDDPKVNGDKKDEIKVGDPKKEELKVDGEKKEEIKVGDPKKEELKVDVEKKEVKNVEEKKQKATRIRKNKSKKD